MDAVAVERHLTLPCPPARLWEALTTPEEVAGWFGLEVEWELAPGAPARWHGDGADRGGVIEEVAPGRRLSFRWWPTDGDGPASTVTYEIEPDPDGSRLTVREEPATVDACAAVPGPWTAWDSRHLNLWARAQACVGATA